MSHQNRSYYSNKICVVYLYITSEYKPETFFHIRYVYDMRFSLFKQIKMNTTEEKIGGKEEGKGPLLLISHLSVLFDVTMNMYYF